MVNESLSFHRQMEELIADIRREGDGQAADWQRSIDRAEVTHHFKLDEIETAYELFSHQLDGVLKIAITP